MTAYVVGIAGPSCSGKSLIAKQLASIYSRHSPCVLALDSYYHDLSGLQPSERAGQNYDTPEAIDVELLETQLTTLLAGGEIEKPVYDYETHTRSAVTERIGPTNLILAEGLFALYWEKICRLLDTRIFVTLPAELALSRRLERDVNERGRNSNSVLAQYEQMLFYLSCKSLYLSDREDSGAIEKPDSRIDGTGKRSHKSAEQKNR